MKILSISFDKGLFDKRSDGFQRQAFYASSLTSYTVVVLTLKSEKKQKIIYKNLTIVPTNSLSKIFYLLDTLNLLRKNKTKENDLITVQDPFLIGLIGVIVKLFYKIPLNIQIHSEFFNSKYFRKESLVNLCFYFLGKITLRFADSVRARNRRIAAWVIKSYPYLKGRTLYVPAPLNKIFLTKLSKIKRNPNLIVTNGRLTAQKNYPLLLASFQKVLKDFPKAQLHIVGVGEDFNKIQQLSKNLHISQHIKFLGWIDPVKWKRILDEAALFVLASNHEGWGLVCLEALARGTPVVMTDTGCAGEIVINNKTGIVVQVGDKQKLVIGIQNVLNNSRKFQKMAKTGRILVNKDSSPVFWRKSISIMFQQTIKTRH